MEKNSKNFLIPILAGMFLVGSVVIGSEIPFPHLLEKTPRRDCGLCHIRLSPPEAKKEAVFVRPGLASVCIGCHTRIQKFPSHKIGIRPISPLPAGFPLDREGLMDCITCHVVHGDLGKQPFFLRKPFTGKAFCKLCHSDSLARGKIAPAFSARALGGSTVESVKIFHRRTAALLFFSSSQPPSLEWLTDLENLTRQVGADQLAAVAVSADFSQSEKDLSRILNDLDPIPTYPVIQESAISLIEMFDIRDVPAVIVIDRQGRIRFRSVKDAEGEWEKISSALLNLIES